MKETGIQLEGCKIAGQMFVSRDSLVITLLRLAKVAKDENDSSESGFRLFAESLANLKDDKLVDLIK